MSKIIMLKGLPASGKSTWAKEQVTNGNGQIKRVNKDDLRAMIDCSKWSKDREEQIIEAQNELIKVFLTNGKTVIVDDTNFEWKHYERLERIADSFSKCDFEVNASFCDVPLRECLRRDALRPNPVGREVINRMARQYGVGVPKPYPYDEALEDVVICDLDGTLAHIGCRNPYDASTCELDTLNEPVAHYLKQTDYLCKPIYLFSGREEKYREPTEKWLNLHRIGFDRLVMRSTGDNRKDSIIKREMFEEHVRGKYNVRVVLDDRQQVVDMWRDLGLNVWQVAEGNF